MELARLEMVFKLLTRKNLQHAEDYDTSAQTRSPSFKFYETVKVIRFHRCNNFQVALEKRVL